MNNYITYILVAVFVTLLPLTVSSQDSCVTTDCHPDFQQEHVLHPEDVACASCHEGSMEVHGQDGEKLRLSETMCAGCHEEQQGNYPHPHPPVVTGNCYICHNPHGNIEKMLLPEDFSLGEYVKYSEDEYKLCFLCHKRDLLMFPDTSLQQIFEMA